MRYALALAAIPVVVWAAWPASPRWHQQGDGIVVRAVATEGVRAQRQDDTTFTLRWRPVNDLPPATSTTATAVVEREEARAGVTRIDTVRPRPRRTMRYASLGRDICARHGMRRVTYTRGRWQGWRCRR